jgi:uncharacterized Zn finger protein (UPF0148 family)
MKKKKPISICPNCKSTCLWHKPDGTVLCTVCLTLMDKEGKAMTKREIILSGL